MVDRTFGGAGDFATVRDSWVWMQGLMPLLDDYTFHQVGDVPEIDNWPAGAPALDTNRHTVTYTCPWSDSAQGDPTKGFKIQKTGAGIIEMRIGVLGNPSTIADTLILENLYFEKMTNDNVAFVRPNSWVIPSTAIIRVRNCIFKGHTWNGIGLYFNNSQDHVYLSNLKLEDFWEALYDLFGPGGGVHLGENISINNSRVGWRFWNGTWTYRNCVGTNCAAAWAAGTPNYTLINCADDDGTIAGGATVQVNCRGNITPADEFQSTDFTNENWLKLIEGTYTHPDTFTGGAPDLGRTGAVSVISNLDSAGEARPGADGEYSIGAHELQYAGWPYVPPPEDSWGGLSRTTDRFLKKPNWIQAGAVDFDFNRELIEFPGTQLEIYRLSQDAPFSLSYKFTNLSREDEYYITNFFCEHRGKHKRFWIPLWKNMFTLTNDIATGDGIITIPNVGFHLVDRGYERIFIELKNGYQISRKVTAVLADGLNENLILEGIMDRVITQDNIKYFSRLLLVRFNDDGLVLKYRTDNKSEIELTFYELTNEYELEAES